MTKNNNFRAEVNIFVFFAIVAFTFYGRNIFTWFQQDEWSLFGWMFKINSDYPLPGVNGFIWGSFPYPRFSFAPLHWGFLSLTNYLFGLQFTPYAILAILIHSLNAYLVSLVTYRLSNDKKMSVVAGSVFAFYSIGQKTVTWPLSSMNAGIAASFSLLSLIYFHRIIDERVKYGYTKVILILLCALWFSEQAMIMFIILPVFSLLYTTNKETKKLLKYLISFFVIYASARFFAVKVGVNIHKGFVELPEYLSISQYFNVITWAPVKSLVGVFFTPQLILKLSHLITPLIWPQYRNLKGTTRFGQFSESTGIEAVTILLFILISTLLLVLYKKFIRQMMRKLFLLSTIFILSSSLISLLLAIRGQSAIGIYIMRSRDLYLASSGASILVSMVFVKLWNKHKKITIFAAIIFMFYHWNFINNFIINPEIDKAVLRRPIIVQIYSTYPKIPEKVLFYTKSDTSYYGSELSSMPYQTGFGRTLLVWYWYNNKSFPTSFLGDDYLYLPGSEGYREVNEYGFGYFTDFDKMQSVITVNNLGKDSVFAFSWSGVTNTLTNITNETRLKLK